MLYNIMEDIGASKAVQNMRVVQSSLVELHEMLNAGRQNSPLYVVGSAYEGSSTTGLIPDLDLILPLEDMPVVEDLPEAVRKGHCLFLVQDLHTPPGYVKLQGVANGVPRVRISAANDPSSTFVKVDGDNRYVFTITNLATGSVRFGEIRGPALTNSRAVDYIPAVRCRHWPSMASEWLTRRRRKGWPPTDVTTKCKDLGCFFVQVGHPNSDENDLQWRNSFSLAERELVTIFNSVQLKCYILLKVLKKDIISDTIAENILTSYHCKTCILFMIENTASSFWVPNNLLACLQMCLDLILRWCTAAFCPNYFIPAENMFEGRIHSSSMIRLRHILNLLILSESKYLVSLQTDNLGKHLTKALSARSKHVSVYPRNVSVKSLVAFKNATKFLILLDNVLQQNVNNNTQTCVKVLCTLKKKLQHAIRRNENTNVATQKAISVVLSYLDLYLMSNLIVLGQKQNKRRSTLLNALLSEKWHKVSLMIDSFSGRLKQASLLCMLGYWNISLDILVSLEDKLSRGVQSLCCCRAADTQDEVFSEPSFVQNDSFEELLHETIVPCVAFTPSERELTHSALCCEMIQTACSGHRINRGSFDVARVDGKILIYFLMFQNHKSLGLEANARADIANMEYISSYEHFLGHRDVAFNLIGWIYREMGFFEKAIKCFHTSLNINPDHNAANCFIRELQDLL